MATVACVLQLADSRASASAAQTDSFAISSSPHSGKLQVYSWFICAIVDDVYLVSLLQSVPLLPAFNGCTFEPPAFARDSKCGTVVIGPGVLGPHGIRAYRYLHANAFMPPSRASPASDPEDCPGSSYLARLNFGAL